MKIGARSSEVQHVPVLLVQFGGVDGWFCLAVEAEVGAAGDGGGHLAEATEVDTLACHLLGEELMESLHGEGTAVYLKHSVEVGAEDDAAGRHIGRTVALLETGLVVGAKAGEAESVAQAVEGELHAVGAGGQGHDGLVFHWGEVWVAGFEGAAREGGAVDGEATVSRPLVSVETINQDVHKAFVYRG